MRPATSTTPVPGPTTIKLIEDTRARMKVRWDRANRRLSQLTDHLELASVASCTLIGDDFVAVLHELKEIIYDFGCYAKKRGLVAKRDKAYEMVNAWRDNWLNSADRAAWNYAMKMRDDEVHEAPIPRPSHVVHAENYGYLSKAGEDFWVREHRWVVTLPDGRNVDVVRVATQATRAMERFIREFDRL